MTNKKFNAVLAKNNIARYIRRYFDSQNQSDDCSNEPLYIQDIIPALKEIEEYLGQDNQPSIEEILTSERADI